MVIVQSFIWGKKTGDDERAMLLIIAKAHPFPVSNNSC
jgi:hypothetical protein